MKNFKKITAIFLSLLFITLSFVSCKGDEVTGDESTDTDADSVQTTAPVDENSISVTGEYIIAYPKSADAGVYNTIEAFKKTVDELLGASVQLIPESNGKLKVETDKEIFIGKSDRDVYASLYEDLEYGEWRIKAVGNSIILAAETTTATLDALEYFKSEFVKGGKIVVPKEFEYKKEATFTVESISLGGIDLSEYSIVYSGSNKMALQAATDLIYSVGIASGVDIPLVKAVANAKLEKAIVIGDNVSHTSDTTEYGESKVYVTDGIIYVDGKDIVGLETGISYLARLLTAEKNVSVELSELSYSGNTVKDRSEYLNGNADEFIPCYAERIQTPENKLPLSYKVEQLNKVDGEVLVIAHRGEHTYYPQNSLESLISAWRIGAFAVELDIHKTKDGYYIGAHDAELNGANNNFDFSLVKLKDDDGNYILPAANPGSMKISDWTLEELRQLRVIDDFGTVTPFTVVTVQEAMHACDDRIFLHLDKVTASGDPSYGEHILAIMEEENIYECVYAVNGVGGLSAYETIVNNAAANGKTLHCMPRISGLSSLQSYYNMTKENDKLAPAGVLYGDFVNATDYDNVAVRDNYSSKLRVATWVLREADNQYYWRLARGYKYSIFLTDHPYELLQVIR